MAYSFFTILLLKGTFAAHKAKTLMVNHRLNYTLENLEPPYETNLQTKIFKKIQRLTRKLQMYHEVALEMLTGSMLSPSTPSVLTASMNEGGNELTYAHL